MIDPKDKAQIDAEASAAREALAIVTTPGWAITTDAQSVAIGAHLVDVKRRMKAIDEARKRLLAPVLEAQRSINEFFGQGSDPLKRLEAIMKAALVTYAAKVEAQRRAAMVAVVPIPPPPTDVKGITYRTRREFRVVDEAAVPREFCSPDPAKIKAAVGAVPGVEFYEVQTPVVRT